MVSREGPHLLTLIELITYLKTPCDSAKLMLHYGDLSDSSNLTKIINDIQPDEIYNLGAQSHVAVSFDNAEYTADIDALGALRILEAIRFLKMTDKVKFYQASSSELYGLVQEVPQKESTPFLPSITIRCSKTICVLDNQKLSRILWNICMQWNII